MDERILALLGSFAEIERELGPGVLDSAIERARLAVAAEVMVEAERRALTARRQQPPCTVEGNVITLPLTHSANRLRSASAGNTDGGGKQ